MNQLNDPELLNQAFAIGTLTDEIVVTNPYNHQALCAIDNHTVEQVNHAIADAKVAQADWAKLSAKQRANILRRWHDLVLAAADDLATIMTLEQGKPLLESTGEVAYGASFIEWFSEEAKRAYGRHIPSPASDRHIVTLKQPVGVTAGITPWNFPIAMITRKAAPALAAGCAFVVKPAANTPLSALALAQLAYRAGIPPALMPVVCSLDAPLIGSVFTQHPDIRKLSFTGSTAVGKQLMSQSAAQLQRLSLELGGNAPFVVFADADLNAAVDGAIASKFRNAGQTCVCANRFYIAREIHDEFVSLFVAKVAALTVGNGMDSAVQVGPLIDERALNKVNDLVDKAIAAGATLVCGGQPAPAHGNCFLPTVLTDVTPDNPILKQEIFGPVAPICVFDSEQEVIAQCNDTEYGLASYFYSRDINRIWRVAAQLECGMVGINEGIISTELAPFGGVKHSGIGREGGSEGLDEYLETKYLCMGGLD
ncbi:NAD-dependent succinate-semialdehyde dehydrogenase [Neiella holothuriorum]|uniref:NAD-dependent succinate-semialdehyde dehydrogenase n=1 Tax=Neiella holothuriorum TaxID=2870530 RepID=UPI00384C2B1B